MPMTQDLAVIAPELALATGVAVQLGDDNSEESGRGARGAGQGRRGARQ